MAQRSGGVRRLSRFLPRARDRASVVGPGGRLAQLPRAVAQRGVRAVLRRALRAASARRRGVRGRAAPVAPVGDERVRSGAGLPRLSARPHPRRQPRLPRARLQQGRRGAAHAAAPGRRRGVLPRRLRRFYRESRFTKAGTDDFRARDGSGNRAGRSIASSSSWIYGSTLPQLKFSYRVDGAELGAAVEQLGEVFDVPVTVTLQYADRKPVDVVVPVTERRWSSAASRAQPARLRRASRSTRTTATLAEIVQELRRTAPLLDMIVSLWKPSR